jgi:hypothetical protein
METKKMISTEVLVEKNLENFADFIKSLTGLSFVGIPAYVNKAGEVANHTININANVKEDKQADYDMFVSLQENTDFITKIALKYANGNINAVTAVLDNMVASAKKNLSENIEDRSNQSQGQTNAFEWITNGISVHKTTGDVFIFGKKHKKSVIVEGVYKVVKHRPETIIKNGILANVKIRTKYGRYNVDKIKELRYNKVTETLELCRE